MKINNIKDWIDEAELIAMNTESIYISLKCNQFEQAAEELNKEMKRMHWKTEWEKFDKSQVRSMKVKFYDLFN